MALRTFRSLGYRIDEVRVTGRQRLDAIDDASGLRFGGGSRETFASAFPRFLSVFALADIPLLGRAMNQCLAAQVRAKSHQTPHNLDGLLADGWI